MIITRSWQRTACSSGLRLLLLHASRTPPQPQSMSFVAHAPPSRALFHASATSAIPYNFPYRVSVSLRRSYSTGESLADHPVESIVEVPLAQTGEGIAECELLKWFVQEVS